ncbi:MAG: hypothetical protein K0Q58_915, partial [Microbacterium sp.]|nr:hypothetical protein [Microbacterium sp.]
MEPLFEFLAAWWWTGPTTVGLGAVGYAGLTTGRRRARRLALDAARVEEGAAARALVAARAQTKSAQAQLLTAQARNGTAPGSPAVAEARRQLHSAKQAQKSAALEVRASRSRVRAERTRLAAASGTDETPLAQVVHQHDAVLARWLEYETDVETAIAFPQMSDPRDPMTAAFLHA